MNLPEGVYTRGVQVLSNLGFDTDRLGELSAKNILDIGADNAEAVQVFRAHGVGATPLDKRNPDNANNIDGYVVVDASKPLAFNDETFDITMSHANPVFDNDEHLEAFEEVLRITKKGGEFRIGPFFSHLKT